MYTIDLSSPIFSIDGSVVASKTLSSVLAELLGMQTEGRSLKLYGWYRQCLAQEPLILDESDMADLKKLIDENKNVFVYIKGQLLEALGNSK
jgi:hypothetical protein